MTALGFTSKFFKSKLKYGITTEEILSYFSLSEEAFHEKLNQTFSQDAVEDFLRQLKKNDKKKSHLSKRLQKTSEGPVLSNLTILTPEDFEDSEGIEELQATKTLDISALDLASLQDLLQTLLKEKDEIELYHKELKSQNSKERECLKDVKEKADMLKSQLLELTNLANSYIIVINKNTEIMAGLTQQLSEKRATIKEVEEQIRELEKIVIFVYTSGEIEFEDKQYHIPDEAMWQPFYQQIVSGAHPQSVLFESLTMAQIKQISKLFCFSNSVQNLLDITFENSEVQKVWSEFTKK